MFPDSCTSFHFTLLTGWYKLVLDLPVIKNLVDPFHFVPPCVVPFSFFFLRRDIIIFCSHSGPSWPLFCFVFRLLSLHVVIFLLLLLRYLLPYFTHSMHKIITCIHVSEVHSSPSTFQCSTTTSISTHTMLFICFQTCDVVKRELQPAFHCCCRGIRPHPSTKSRTAPFTACFFDISLL